MTDQYIESIYEAFFFLKYHGGWSFTECYSLPIAIRKWFLGRLVKQIKEEKEAQEKAAQGSNQKR